MKRQGFFPAAAMLWIALGMAMLGVLVERFAFIATLSPDSWNRAMHGETADIGLELGENWLYESFEAGDIPRARDYLFSDPMQKISALRHDGSAVSWSPPYPDADLEIYIADTSYDIEIFGNSPKNLIPVIAHQLPSEENGHTGRYFYFIRSSAGRPGKNFRMVCEELLEFVVEGPFGEFKGATRLFYKSKAVSN